MIGLTNGVDAGRTEFGLHRISRATRSTGKKDQCTGRHIGRVVDKTTTITFYHCLQGPSQRLE